MFFGFLFLMHLNLPGERLPRERLWPGVLVTTVALDGRRRRLLVLPRFTPSFTVTYGTLTGVIITLIFFYLTGATIIFGAEVNAA